MRDADYDTPLEVASGLARRYLAGIPQAPVGPTASASELRASLGGPLPEQATDASQVLSEMAAAAADGLAAIQSGRYFGFVNGGGMPTPLAADWLVSAWDQNCGLFVMGPAASVVEEVAGAWLAQLLGLPRQVSFGFVTGAQMANVTALAAARHEVLRRVGWDVEHRGLTGSPGVRVVVGEERHTTVDRALRLVGLGSGTAVAVPADRQGRMRADALGAALDGAAGVPTIVCAQAGNVNSGHVDPLRAICEQAHAVGAWVHVDGAFGLWAGASAATRHLVDGVELADSWATDAHKWLNVPYDSGLVFCAHSAAHRAAMGVSASYLPEAPSDERDEVNYNPEASRRARGFPVYAALRSLGRSGVADLVDRSCALARLFATSLAANESVEVLNDVVLNQVLVRFLAADGDPAAHDALTRRVVERVQRDGTCWLAGTTWQGRAAMRISVSNWRTDEDDVHRTVDAILRCHAECVADPTRV